MPGSFQLKTQNKLKGKTLEYHQLNSFIFRFILSFQLKISRHDNSTLNLEFCMGNARAPNSSAFFLFAQWIFINFYSCKIHGCVQCLSHFCATALTSSQAGPDPPTSTNKLALDLLHTKSEEIESLERAVAREQARADGYVEVIRQLEERLAVMEQPHSSNGKRLRIKAWINTWGRGPSQAWHVRVLLRMISPYTV